MYIKAILKGGDHHVLGLRSIRCLSFSLRKLREKSAAIPGAADHAHSPIQFIIYCAYAVHNVHCADTVHSVLW